MNLDLLYMIPIYFGNDIIPKYIHFGFAFLTSFLIFSYLRRRMNRVYGLLGMLFFLSLPIMIKLSITAYVDLGLVFFSTAALLLIIRWLNDGFSLRVLILAAICCGLGMGTKYNGLIVFLLLGLFVPFLYAKYRLADKALLLKCLGQWMIFSFVAVLVFSPWMIRNYLWTQNPLYPLYEQWFNSQSNDPQSVIGILAYRSLAYHEQWWEIALLPIRIFFQGQDNDPQYFDGRLNPGLFIFSFFAFLRVKDESQAIRREKMLFVAFAALFYGFAFFTSDLRVRYLLPIIPPLVLLSVIGLWKLINLCEGIGTLWGKRGAWIGVFGCASICLLLNLQYIITQFRTINPLSYISGSVSREEFLSKYRPEYPVMQYINRNLSSDALVLFFFIGNRGYYCDRDYLFDMQSNKSWIQQMAENSDKVEDIRKGLLGMHVTHILMNDGIFGRWVDANPDNKERWLMRQFVNIYLNRLFSRNGYTLYALQGALYKE
jgi:hypothetical protein